MVAQTGAPVIGTTVFSYCGEADRNSCPLSPIQEDADTLRIRAGVSDTGAARCQRVQAAFSAPGQEQRRSDSVWSREEPLKRAR